MPVICATEEKQNFLMAEATRDQHGVGGVPAPPHVAVNLMKTETQKTVRSSVTDARNKGLQLCEAAKQGRHQILSKQGGEALYKNMFEISDNGRKKIGVTLTFSHEIEANQNSGLYDAVRKMYIPNRDDHTDQTLGCTEKDLYTLQLFEGGEPYYLKASPAAMSRIRDWYSEKKETETGKTQKHTQGSKRD